MKLLLVLAALVAVSCATSPLNFVCRDYSRSCKLLAKLGFCRILVNNGRNECPKSCHTCGQATSAPATVAPGPPQKDVKCGVPTAPGSRIIGGEFAKKDAWPWQIALYYGRQFMCGGSILSPNWIITAAHCVDGFNYKYYTVVVGDYDRKTRDGDEQYFKAVRAFHHPDWNSPSPLNHDIALIELNKPIIFNNHVKPVCLPAAGEQVPVGTECYITGWGQYTTGRSGPPETTLKQSPLNVVSKETCTNLNTVNMEIPITKEMVCAGLGPEKENSGCHGDSGGPFVCKNGDGAWVLQGSVSWGNGYCLASEGYTVFARLGEMRHWIDKYVN